MDNPLMLAVWVSGCASVNTPPAEERHVCAEGEIDDDGTCVAEACGTGTWGGISTGDDTIYVDVTADGVGTLSSPLHSIQAALDLAGERGGGEIAVASGTYAESLQISDDQGKVTLRGRCRDMVTIDGSQGHDVPAIKVTAVRRRYAVNLEGLTVTGGKNSAVWTESANVSIRATDIRASSLVGLGASGGNLVLDDVGVYGTRPDRQGKYGWGIDVEAGATLTVTSSVVQGNAEVGVFAWNPGTTVTLTDTAVLDNVSGRMGNAGWGIGMQDGAALTVTRGTIEGNTETGVYVQDSGTIVQLDDTRVIDTRSRADGAEGRGLVVQLGATVVADSCLFAGNTDIGVYAVDPGTNVDLVDSTVRGTRVRPDGRGGRGIVVSDGASLQAIRSRIDGNHEVGVLVAGADTSASLADTVVADTAASLFDEGGSGLVAQGGASVSASRCSIEDNVGSGVVSSNPGTTVDLRDTLVTRTRRGGEMGFALGVRAQKDAALRARSCEVSETEGAGLFVTVGAAADVEDVSLVGNRFAGAVVLEGTLRLANASVSDNLADAEWGGGFGVYASDIFEPPNLTLTDSVVGPHDYAAVWLDGAGSYALERNVLSGSGGVVLSGHPAHGNAIFAENGISPWDGTNGLLLAENTLTDASMISVLLHQSSAALYGNLWVDNTDDLRQQHCDAAVVPIADEQLEGIPEWIRCPEGDVLTDRSMQFTTLFLPEVDAEE